MKIKMIWSTDPNGYIGSTDGKLCHTCKGDMVLFKELTTGYGNNAVVMGRKTYESIGKPLPNRLNIILTKNQEYKVEESLDLHISHYIGDVLDTCKEHGIDELWVIGGKEIYEQFLELTTELQVTRYNEYSSIEPEQAVQFLPDLYEFTLDSSEEFNDGNISGSFNYYWRH